MKKIEKVLDDRKGREDLLNACMDVRAVHSVDEIRQYLNKYKKKNNVPNEYRFIISDVIYDID